MTEWRLAVARSAERDLSRLRAKVAAAVAEFMLGPLLEKPHRVGKPLARELSGCRVARRGPYRIVYGIDEPTAAVQVVRIDHRSPVYRPR